MGMKLTASELKERYPRKFEKEHEDWINQLWDDWWDYVWEGFKEDMQAKGMSELEGPQFDLYRRYAMFSGTLKLSTIMEETGAHEKYYPLYLAVVQARDYVRCHPKSRSDTLGVAVSSYSFSSNPEGVFSDMDDDDWQDLVGDLWKQCDPESLALEYCNDLCHDLLKRLDDAYGWETSEENFIEMCETNEVTFEVNDDEIQD
jgi:hypothetical protein